MNKNKNFCYFRYGVYVKRKPFKVKISRLVCYLTLLFLLIRNKNSKFTNFEHLDYWNRDFNTWGINDWDTYWIEKQSQPTYITKHNSHTTLGDEPRYLKQIYTSLHPAYDKIDNLLEGLRV